MRGVSVSPAGANDVNHAFGGTFSPFVAVPVLPATTTPGICAAVPVPPATTLIIMCRMSSADAALSGLLNTSGENSRIFAPVVAARTSVTRRGAYIVPPFAIAAAISDRCSGL
jgi:hypothetical protein